MSWNVIEERVQITKRKALINELESTDTIRQIEIEVDPEHPDYCICLYQKYIE